MATNVLFLFALLRTFSFSSAYILEGNKESAPEWSQQYSVKGVFYLPLNDLQESFNAWIDNKNNKFRVDYKTSGASVYVLPPSESLPEGSLRKTFYITTTNEQLELKCLKTDNKTRVEKAAVKYILPNMTGFVFKGTENLLGIKAMKWQKVITNVHLRKEFNVWAKTEDEKTIPLKYEVNVYNTMLGTHVTRFYLEYSEYNTTNIDMLVFNKTNNMTCESEEKIYVNPMEAYLFRALPKSTEVHFEKFKQLHGRQYASDLEHETRLEIFRENLKYINEHNQGDSTYKMAVNHFADRTEDELAALFGNIHSAPDSEKGLSLSYSSAEKQNSNADDIPAQLDWRLYGAVTPVKNQLTCGSCWAFAAVGAMEGALFLHYNRSQHVVRLSEQALVDCAWRYSNCGCQGGSCADAFKWIKEYGLPTDEAYGGYFGENGRCHIKNITRTAFISEWAEVKQKDVIGLKAAIVKYGPIAVGFSAKKSILFYSSGVYYDPKCIGGLSNHAALVVGYGNIDNSTYWIIKNSWGSRWGLNGYFLISTENNNCGIIDDPLYVVAKNVTS